MDIVAHLLQFYKETSYYFYAHFWFGIGISLVDFTVKKKNQETLYSAIVMSAFLCFNIWTQEWVSNRMLEKIV
jgi:hypothetical protein